MATYGWVTDAEADAYLAAGTGAAIWAELGSTQKAQLLTEAFRRIYADSRLELPSTPEQAQKDAQCEAALYLQRIGPNGATASDMRAQGIQSLTLSRQSATLMNVSEAISSGLLGFGPMADSLLRRYLKDKSPIVSIHPTHCY